jgi:transposase
MSRLDLTPGQRRELRRQLVRTRDVRVYRRTLAVLEVDRGHAVADLARMLGVTRQSIYHWVEAYAERRDPEALEDEPGRGRHRLLDEDQEHLLEALLTFSPQRLGAPHGSWSVPLLGGALEALTDQEVSEDTVRRALHRLGYVWKWPRYDLLPDPQRAKKTADPRANRGSAGGQRRAGRGRDRPGAVPAVAGCLVPARRRGPRLAEREKRPAGDLRGP